MKQFFPRVAAWARLLLVSIVAVMLLPGCERQQKKKRTDEVQIGYQQTTDDLAVIVVLDLSGSFTDELFGKDAKAWHCIQRILGALHQDRSGQNDRLILSQISSSDRALLWEGSLADFRRSFGSETAFRSFIFARAQNQASRVWDSISDSIEYALKSPTIVKGRTKVAVFVLSDMDDNIHTPQSYTRMVHQLAALADHHGLVGLYFVTQNVVDHYRTQLRSCGFPSDMCYVGAEFTRSTPLPTFKK